MDRTARIRELNDAFRKSFVGGKVMLTQAVDGLNETEKATLLAKIRAFADFNGDNDPPYGTERVYNALRLAHALVKREPSMQVTSF